MKVYESQWAGNKWSSIDIEPRDERLFFKLLDHFAAIYNFPMPRITDTIDGYAADFNVLDSTASLDIDTWMFSIAFEKIAVRDHVLAALRALPENYFEP